MLLHAGHNMISGYPHIGLMPLVRVVCQRPLLSRIHSTGSGRTPLVTASARPVTGPAGVVFDGD